jgi:BirA family transcriptional regulator, biotin operon repressor / biotin---[acetyl-CoA-carboxylase] ligase
MPDINQSHSKAPSSLHFAGVLQILRFDSIDSTNLEGMRQAKAGAPEGLCIVAREQTRGRGRLDRSWQSPPDAGLYMSLLLRPKFEMTTWPLITLMAALAVYDALRKVCDLPADIKWPNDLCIDDRKLCGILAETVETQLGSAAVVGIGINLSSDIVKSVPVEAVSVESVTGRKPDAESILSDLLKSLGEKYELLHSSQGREHLVREWCAHSSYAIGRRVRVTLSDRTFEGTTRGLEADGALRVEAADGRMRIVRAGDVTALRSTV